jgi:pyruvate dehydrogenase E2 component (dihydrolipoamide acetyltransferase)
MPQLGETVTEGTITRWAKQVGDSVAADEVLFEVSTDKVDSEVPSPAAGTLTEILVQEGDTADVGAILARLGEAGESGGSSAAPASESAPAKEEAPVAQEAEQQAPAPAPSPTPAPAPAAPTPSAPAAPQSSGDSGGKVLSPVVRKLINENGLDPANITGTGAGGRITRDDVQKAIAGGSGAGTPRVAAASAPQGSSPNQSSGSAPSRPAPAPLPAAKPGERDTVVPFSNIRKRTAEHMVMSQATSAHTLVTVEVDYENVDRVRKANKSKFKEEEGTSLTYLPFITRAVVDALREFPMVNASVGRDELIVHRDVNLGVAVDLDFEGLLVPVIHGVDGYRMRQIARAISDVAYRARNKKLQADDITGGTFTITNAGGYGTFVTYPVINQPQVAILSTDGVKKRPVAVELPDGTDAVAVHPTGVLALAWDHRAFDGAYASAFMAKVREVLETRDWANEL